MIQDKGAITVLEKLNSKGFEAYIVGGCVRDLLMGKEPNDYDITTSAKPEDVMGLFHCIPTGLQHGTVTARVNGNSYEVTTFRKDGVYEDHRRPVEVTFASSLEEDLQRRDFTMNAIAMDSQGHLLDPFGGREDIEKRCIRAVGNPNERMEEDALRIMRGLRFASTLGFSVEEKTKESIVCHKEDLRSIAVERIQVELAKLLLGDNVENILREYVDVLGVVIPEILPTVGFDQHNSWHKYTLWEHILHSVGNIRKDRVLRYTMLLHDLGKIKCFTVDEKGTGHFYGHGELSGEIAHTICRRLKMDKETSGKIEKYIRIHDYSVPENQRQILKMLHRVGEEIFEGYLEIRAADSLAQSEKAEQVLYQIENTKAIYKKMKNDMPCYTISMLKVNGNDVMEYGISGGEIGKTLDTLLQKVMQGKIENVREILLAEIQEMSKEQEERT